jgi:hypothetical protein
MSEAQTQGHALAIERKQAMMHPTITIPFLPVIVCPPSPAGAEIAKRAGPSYWQKHFCFSDYFRMKKVNRLWRRSQIWHVLSTLWVCERASDESLVPAGGENNP